MLEAEKAFGTVDIEPFAEQTRPSFGPSSFREFEKIKNEGNPLCLRNVY